MPSRVQFLFLLFTVYSLTPLHWASQDFSFSFYLCTTLLLDGCPLTIKSTTRNLQNLQNQLQKICRVFYILALEVLDSLWEERNFYKHQTAIIPLPRQGEAILVVPLAHFKLLLLVNKTKQLSSWLKVFPIGRDNGANR